MGRLGSIEIGSKLWIFLTYVDASAIRTRRAVRHHNSKMNPRGARTIQAYFYDLLPHVDYFVRSLMAYIASLSRTTIRWCFGVDIDRQTYIVKNRPLTPQLTDFWRYTITHKYRAQLSTKFQQQGVEIEQILALQWTDFYEYHAPESRKNRFLNEIVADYSEFCPEYLSSAWSRYRLR